MNTNESPRIAMCDCESSQVTAHGYDQETKTMAVRFKSGGEYHYIGVDPATYDRLKKAESVGKFIGAEIKGKFEFNRVSPDKSA